MQVDTTNILFICGGAFVGLDEQVANRTIISSMGFGAPVRSGPAHTTYCPTCYMLRLILWPTLGQGRAELQPSLLACRKRQASGERIVPEAVLQDIQPQDLQSYGLIPEFVGRFPVICSLKVCPFSCVQQLCI